jgi:hypothetical protein
VQNVQSVVFFSKILIARILFAASPHRRIAASPCRRIAASPHRRVEASLWLRLRRAM